MISNKILPKYKLITYAAKKWEPTGEKWVKSILKSRRDFSPDYYEQTKS